MGSCPRGVIVLPAFYPKRSCPRVIVLGRRLSTDHVFQSSFVLRVGVF